MLDPLEGLPFLPDPARVLVIPTESRGSVLYCTLDTQNDAGAPPAELPLVMVYSLP